MSNIGQTRSGNWNLATHVPAHAFTTGTNTAGYTLDDIEVQFFRAPSGLTVKLVTGLTSTLTEVATLTNPASLVSGDLTFTASNTTLSANTTYWVVLEGSAGEPASTSSDEEDSGGAAGWSVADGSHWRTKSGSSWSTTGSALMISVNGSAITSSGPTITISGGSAVTEGTAAQFTLTASPAPSANLTVNLTVSESSGSDYVASTDEGSKTVTINASDTSATYSVATQADSTDEPNGTVTVAVGTGTGYTVGTANSANVTVNDDDDPAPTNSAPVFTSQPSTASVDENSANGTAVATVAATDADGDTITYSLDSTSDDVFAISSTGAITVQVEAGSSLDHEAKSSYAATVTAHDGTVGANHSITISVNDVNEPPAKPAQPTVTGASTTSVTVTWTAPSVTGKPAITDYDVQHRKSGVTAWTDASFTGTGTTTTITGLVAGTAYEAQVRATNAEGTSGWSATGSGSTNNAPVFTNQPTTASVAENSANGTAVATVAATDADGDTITYSLDSTSDNVFAISSTGAITVQVEAGHALDHEGTSSYSATVTASDGKDTTGHNITIGVTDVNEPPAAPAQPTVTGASTTSVTVTWTAPSVTGKPAITDYDVQYRKSGVTAWTDASFTGTGTTTTIPGLEAGTDYEAQVRATNAEGTSGWSATGSGSTNSPSNNAPVFTSQPSTASVAENSANGTAVATVAATDADGDTITYSLDSTSDDVFAISSTGAITVQVEAGHALDHEGKSSYSATVTASDGTDTTGHNITIGVTDVNEPPEAPATPTVAAVSGSTTSLTVTWTAPSVTGKPAITDYDVQYRKSGVTAWTDASFTGTGTTTTIPGLEAGTAYEAQVRATNAEGTSGWSATGSGSTNSPSNSAPVFTSQPSTASVAENSPGGTPVVTVAATDADGDSLTYSLDATSAAVFAISSAGAITVRSGAVLDHETTPSYATVVTANDGSATAKHSVTITVTDVPEPPAVGTATVSGNTVTIGFSQRLDPTSVPPPAAFIVTVDGSRAQVTDVRLGSVILTLAEAVRDGQQVTVAYDRDLAGSSPLRGVVDGAEVASFGARQVRPQRAGADETEPSRPDPQPLQLALWTDRAGYRAGDTVRLHYSLDPHDDRGRYRTFVYLEKAGGGERRYLAPLHSDGQLRAEAVDAHGLPARAALPRQLAAADRELAWEGAAPEPGLWQFVLELRPGAPSEQVEEFDETLQARRAWVKFVVAERSLLLNVRGFDREIRDDLTLRSDTLHYLQHQLFVRAGATLTIEPGTVVQAYGRQAAIIVEPGGRIVAEGTRQAPVVLTCSVPAGWREPGCWGGLRILGRAPVTRLQGTAPGVLPAERAAYGGTDAKDSSGALRYVRVEFAGASADPQSPAPAVGLYGAGSGTLLEHVQARSSLGDGFAFSGGTAACQRCVASGSGGAGLAWRRGWRGGVSHLYVQHGRSGGDGLSGGHDEQGHDLEPRSLPTLSNVTLVHVAPYGRRGRRGVALRLADGSGVQAESLVAARFGGGAVRAAGRSRLLFDEGGSWVNGALLWLNGAPQVPAFLAEAVEFRARNPQLRDVRDFANPDPRPKLSLDAVMYVLDVLGHDRERYIGAFDWTENWLEEWTVFGPESVYDVRQRAEGGD